MTETKWKVGQAVLIFNVNRGGNGDRAKVTRVGRTLFDVQRESGYSGTETFQIEDGMANDDYSHTFVRTIAEAADLETRAEMVDSLRQRGIEFRLGAGDRRFTTAQLVDLAGLVESFEEDN
jgi:hypothetical protein